jgi:hypothetical protein
MLTSHKSPFLILISSDGILFGKEIKHNACSHVSGICVIVLLRDETSGCATKTSHDAECCTQVYTTERQDKAYI